jgi:hypothetical protein
MIIPATFTGFYGLDSELKGVDADQSASSGGGGGTHSMLVRSTDD